MGSVGTQLKTQVTIEHTIEEAYFLLRTGTWGQKEFEEFVGLYEEKGYKGGYDDGYDHGRTEANDLGWEREYQRGFDQGYEEGHKDGANEGYKDGYADGSREEDYNRRY